MFLFFILIINKFLKNRERIHLSLESDSFSQAGTYMSFAESIPEIEDIITKKCIKEFRQLYQKELESKTKRLRTRMKVANEIVSTESSYVSSLKQLDAFYTQPLSQCTNHSSGIYSL